MAIVTTRRFFLLSAQAEEREGDPDFGGVWRGKQQGVAGNALPETFPLRARLAAAGYTAREDLTGADVRELMLQVRLLPGEAAAVLAALEALPPLG